MRNLLFILFTGLLFAGCKKNEDNTVTVVPITPSNLTATVISTTQVDLSWTDKSTNEDGFKIQRKTGTGNFTDITTVGKDVTNYSDNGLTPNTTYTYRLYATNSAGASLGYTDEVTVTTFGAAVLTTNAITNISNTSAKSGGAISSDGGSPITARGIVWSTTPNPTIALTTKTSDGTGTGAFASNLTELVANTTYYVRAYATNGAGTSYGNEVSFKTLNVDITTGLVAFYPFNGNANDESGNGNNGIVNGATLITDRFGSENKAYYFDAASDNIYNSTIFTSVTSSFAISFWINPENFTNNPSGILETNVLGAVNGWNAFLFHTYINGAAYCGTKADNISGRFILPNNTFFTKQWAHVVFTFENGDAKLYLNKSLIAAKSNMALPTLAWNGFQIGYNTNGRATLGTVDDIRIYNRALTQQEITYLYNN
ncbi:MAG: fibronectin type III domain-containing protein [Bacteroidetes bacterium]|nr:fibronectin type III domain-containing protein [Bacteroidota bacterium]